MAKNNIIGIPSDISVYANQFSFFSRSLTRDLKDKVDTVLMGIPFDLGTTGRPGARYGPKSIRMASSNHCWEDIRWPWDFNTFDYINVIDYGDIDYIPGQPDSVVEAIQKNADKILSADKTLISIGGDHFVTLPLLRSHHQKYGKMALVHFDAHTDCYEKLDHFLGAKKSAAHWASYLVKQGNVDPSTSTQIGIRGNPRTLDWLQASYDIGYQVITMDEYKELGHEKCSKMILDRLGDNPIYVTFDLDCLDATVAPGTANLEPAFRGFNIDEARKLIQCLKGKNVIGGDVACLMPTKDNPNNITSMVAASIMFEIICLISININKK